MSEKNRQLTPITIPPPPPENSNVNSDAPTPPLSAISIEFPSGAEKPVQHAFERSAAAIANTYTNLTDASISASQAAASNIIHPSQIPHSRQVYTTPMPPANPGPAPGPQGGRKRKRRTLRKTRKMKKTRRTLRNKNKRTRRTH